jgi:hypothetical protein
MVGRTGLLQGNERVNESHVRKRAGQEFVEGIAMNAQSSSSDVRV